jgi:hypothetical protein
MRTMGVEQSNSSVLVDEQLVLKLYRRIEAGPGIEAELLRALEQAGFTASPRLCGLIEHSGHGLDATLAIASEYIPSAGDGWELTLATLAAGDTEWLPLPSPIRRWSLTSSWWPTNAWSKTLRVSSAIGSSCTIVVTNRWMRPACT